MASSGNLTKRLLVDAGISAGMRVLDVGCGPGDVSFLAAQLVGQGQVLGIDRAAPLLVKAREQAQELHLSNVSFLEADIGALPSEIGAFDAIVGRRVLMYQPDPISAVRRLARALRPGGLMVFQEHDPTMTPASLMPLPLHERVLGWLWRTVEREGANLHMGFDLPFVLAQAGLEVQDVRAEAVIQIPESIALIPETHHALGTIVRAVLPRIVQHGVATEEEVDIDTLDQRLGEEREKTKTTYVRDMVFSAWARKPL